MNSLRKRLFVTGGVLCTLLLALALLPSPSVATGQKAAEQSTAAKAERPKNVLFIALDDANFDMMMRFMPKTRAIMERAGIRLEGYNAQDPLCCPARAEAMSGQLSHNNNVMSNKPEFGGGALMLDERLTTAPYLQKAGVNVGYLGKYMNGYKYRKDGKVWNPPGYAEWFVPVKKIYQYYNTGFNWNGKMVTRKQYITNVLKKRTNKTIEKFARADKPFVLYTWHLAPHVALFKGKPNRPAIPHPKYRGTVDPDSFSAAPAEDDMSDKLPYFEGANPVTPETQHAINVRNARSGESMRSVDDAVVSAIRKLEREGVLDETLVIVTSDNGEMQGAHRMTAGKIVPYQDSTNVGAWMMGPGVPAGVVSSDMVGSGDIGATVLDVTGVSVPYPIDGQSLLAPLDNRQLLVQAGAYVRPGLWTGDPAVRSYTAVVDEQYKFIRWWTGHIELYDLVADPGELNSLVTARPDLVAEYEAVLARLENCVGQECVVVKEPDVEPSPTPTPTPTESPSPTEEPSDPTTTPLPSESPTSPTGEPSPTQTETPGPAA